MMRLFRASFVRSSKSVSQRNDLRLSEEKENKNNRSVFLIGSNQNGFRMPCE